MISLHGAAERMPLIALNTMSQRNCQLIAQQACAAKTAVHCMPHAMYMQ